MLRAKSFAVVASTFALAGSVFAQAPAPDAKRGAQLAQEVCAACHGVDGNSVAPANPKLAAQHVDYLVKQLLNFKPKEGAAQAERASAIMAGFAAMLSDADVRSVAAHYAAQSLQPAAATDKALVELGQRIYRGGIAGKGIPACAGCHGPNGAGIPSLYPRLHGQFAEYTAAQLVAFRQGERANSAQMTTIAERMSDREVKAVADYIAGLR
ncbi:MAG: cytochrome c4 [Burkholderiaceae bacterium]|nr:cytochrome c4 [Burkholderiaceae bacterium]